MKPSSLTLCVGLIATIAFAVFHAIWWWAVDQAVYPSRLRNRLEARAYGRVSDEPRGTE